MRRAVWLTAEQRDILMDAAQRAYATEGSNVDLCRSLINELNLLNERLDSMQPVVRAVVAGLRMPEDALPVYICGAEVEQLHQFGQLDASFTQLLNPEIPMPPIVLETSPSKTRKRRRK
jgi:hypothetical protein